MMGRRLLIHVTSVLGSTLSPSLAQDDPRPRLLVLTDISSLTAGVAEPDDGQSLIRLMLYANEFNIEGLIATSNLGHGQKTRPDLIRQVVDAYGSLLTAGEFFLAAEALVLLQPLVPLSIRRGQGFSPFGFPVSTGVSSALPQSDQPR
jgi:hypothetical protein